MKQRTIAGVILAVSLAVAGCTPERYAQYDRNHLSGADTLAMLKKQDVITMSKSGVSDSLIVTMLAATNSSFQLKAQDVIDLKNAGVSDKVIDAMITSNGALSTTTPAEGEYYYPPYYWYYGYYPLWYYPSFYIGYDYGHRVVFYRGAYFRNYGFYGRRGIGRRPR